MSDVNKVPSVYNFLYQPVAAEGESEKPAEKFLLGFDNEKYYLHNNLDYSNAQISLRPGTSFTLETPIINLKNSEDFYLELSSQSLSGNFKKVNIIATENFLLKYNSSNAAIFENEQGKCIVFGSYSNNIAIDASNNKKEEGNLAIGGNSKNIYIGSSITNGTQGRLRIVNTEDSDNTKPGVYVNINADISLENPSWKRVVTENVLNNKISEIEKNKTDYYFINTVIFEYSPLQMHWKVNVGKLTTTLPESNEEWVSICEGCNGVSWSSSSATKPVIIQGWESSQLKYWKFVTSEWSSLSSQITSAKGEYKTLKI